MSSKRKPSGHPHFMKSHYAWLEEEKSRTPFLNDPKSVVRKMQTHRPFTPSERNRTLACNPSISSRPSSSISRSHSFDVSEGRPSTGVKLQPIRNQKSKEDQHVEEIRTKSTVAKTPIINLPPRKTSAGSRSLSLPSALPPIIVSGKSLLNATAETKSKESINLPENAYAKEKIENSYCKENYKKQYPREKSETGSLTSSLSQDSQVFIPVESSQSSPRLQEFAEPQKFSAKIVEIASQLEKSCRPGMEGEVYRTLETVCELRRLLGDSNMYGVAFEHRLTILKLLFKLLDSNNASLTLNAAKVILAVRVSGKNLRHLFRVIYKISMDKKNDEDFQNCQVLGPLLNAIRNIEILNDPDALLYSITTVKFLSVNELLLPDLYNADCPQIFLHHLSEINGILENDKIVCSKILIQLIIALRNMAENEVIQEYFISSGTLHQIFYVLKACTKDADVILPAMRFLSKIADNQNGCEAMKSCPDIFSVLTDLFKTHNMHLDILVRLGYVVGNLVSDNSTVALGFYNEPDFLVLLVSTMCDYVHLDKKRKEIGLKTLVYREKLYDFDEKQWKEEIPDVIVKMIRILANMCLHSEIGVCLALDKNCIKSLAKIIVAFKNQDMSQEECWVPFISVLIAVNNLTYFMHNHLLMSSSMIKLTECILPFMNDTYDLQLRLQACSIIGNLTRSPNVRQHILENNFLPLLLSLLGENDKEMLFLAYGIIMNIVIDLNSREVFYKESGVTKLLHRLHLCIGRDWEMVALLCQILWNYCGGNDTLFIPLSTIEVQHLIKVLAYSIKSGVDITKDGENVYQAWKEIFCPVAEKLLQVLKSKTSHS